MNNGPFEYLPEVAPQVSGPSGFQGYMERLAQALSQIQAPQPGGSPGDQFGANFAVGLSRGFAGPHMQRMQEREELNADLRNQARERTVANREDYRARRDHALRIAESRATARPVAQKAMLPVTPEMARANPNYKQGQMLEEDKWHSLAGRLTVSDADRRAAAASERTARNEGRAIENQSFANEAKLWDDYNTAPPIKAYSFLRGNLKTAVEGEKLDSGFGDQMLLFAFGRSREPDTPNVLREGEFATVQEAAGKWESLKNLPSYYFQGKRLSPIGRKQIMKAIRSMTAARRPDFEGTVKNIRSRARRGRVPEDLFSDYPEDLDLLVDPETRNSKAIDRIRARAGAPGPPGSRPNVKRGSSFVVPD